MEHKKDKGSTWFDQFPISLARVVWFLAVSSRNFLCASGLH